MKKRIGTKSADLPVVWISLDPDVAKAFPSGAAVNRALRAVMKRPAATAKTRVRFKAALRRSAA
jgi:hypothetical protein